MVNDIFDFRQIKFKHVVRIKEMKISYVAYPIVKIRVEYIGLGEEEELTLTLLTSEWLNLYNLKLRAAEKYNCKPDEVVIIG